MINALLLGSEKVLFITLIMSLNEPRVINISGDIKSSMFVHEH